MNEVIPPPVVTIEELTAERDAALLEVRKLRAAVNRWQMVIQTAQGNIQKVTSELQVYLRDGIFPE